MPPNDLAFGIKPQQTYLMDHKGPVQGGEMTHAIKWRVQFQAFGWRSFCIEYEYRRIYAQIKGTSTRIN